MGFYNEIDFYCTHIKLKLDYKCWQKFQKIYDAINRSPVIDIKKIRLTDRV